MSTGERMGEYGQARAGVNGRVSPLVPPKGRSSQIDLAQTHRHPLAGELRAVEAGGVRVGCFPLWPEVERQVRCLQRPLKPLLPERVEGALSLRWPSRPQG